jgi:gluconate 2-dehydrogenase gamma chain
MPIPRDVGRRKFLKVGAAAAAVTAVGCGVPASRWRVLSEDEARTLAAACDQIVPRDRDPGAADAGVVSFIDRQLATRRKRDLPLWQAGLNGLDRTSHKTHRKRFADLGPVEQEAVLRVIESGDADATDFDGETPQAFFRRLRDYTMMGFYGDPRHGGNRNRASWKMLGVPDPPLRGRLHETARPPALSRPRPTPLPAAPTIAPRS